MIRRGLPFLLVLVAGLALAGGGSYTGPQNATQIAGKPVAKTAPAAFAFLAYDATAKQYRPYTVDLVWFAGHNGAGTCTCPVVKAGGHIFAVANVAAAPGTYATTSFTHAIAVDGEIEQIAATDLSAAAFTAVVFNPVP